MREAIYLLGESLAVGGGAGGGLANLSARVWRWVWMEAEKGFCGLPRFVEGEDEGERVCIACVAF